MNMQKYLPTIFALCAIGACSNVTATPVTYDFSGVITSGTDLVSNRQVYVNTKVTGSVTFEILNPKAYTWSDGMSRYYAYSESGCIQKYSGVCANDLPAMPAVVTSMVFNGVFGSYVVDQNDFGGRFEGSVDRDVNRKGNGTPPQTAQYYLSNHLASNNGYSSAQIHEYGSLDFSGVNLFSDYKDLAGALNLDGAYASFSYGSENWTHNCTQYHCDPFVYSAGAGTQTVFGGRLDSFTLRKAAEVPEPGSALLVLAGVAGLMARRRRQ